MLFLNIDQMDDTTYSLLFFLPFLIAAIYAIIMGLRYHYWFKYRSIEPHYKIILEKYYDYYRFLPSGLKGDFERRVSLFVRGKTYYGKDGLEITDEMRVLVAATAVQITFGFKFFQLPRFSKILIHPTKYFNSKTKKHHKGEVYPMGKWIRLSWDNFLHGFGNPHDGINLGLHEMTHAMSLENRIRTNGAHSYINPRAYADWKPLALDEMERIKHNQKSIFRKYASTNLEEFLAVSVEVFFEQTEQFHQYHPELYTCTCRLLQQDPLHNKLKRK
jgi:Mlc titration factor MtfA (ptsG expression regulator)